MKKKKVTTRKLLSGPNTVAMKKSKATPLVDNLFETISSRRKFDFIGKKRKGETNHIGLSRYSSIEKRKNTLLKEYLASGKSFVFLDGRIGEQNNQLEEFDKAILRYQRVCESKSNRKKRKYNLSDGEENDCAFLQKDDFDDGIALDDETDETKKMRVLRQRGADNAQSESGSLGRDGSKPKSHKEVMVEVMLKDKYYRAQKAKDKEEDEQLMKELDKKFEDWKNSHSFNALSNKRSPKESLEVRFMPIQGEGPDAYDKQVKRLAGDMRAAPSDRTKTPEEIALEEKERLEQLEKQRQKRMDDDSSDGESNDDNEDSCATSSKKVRSVSGDDLGESFFPVEEEVGNKKGWVDDIIERESRSSIEEEDSASFEESDGEENGEEDGNEEDNVKYLKSSSLIDWELSDDSDDLSGDLEGDNHADEGIEAEPTIKQPPIEQDTLPFVIEAPKTFSELSKFLENRSDADIIEAINRIRACNGVRLAAENREKMQIFYANLLMYFAILTTKKPLNFNLLNLLVKPLVEMSMDIPFYAAVCARERLCLTRELFYKDIHNPGKSCWPSMKTLCLLRLWSITFPCSDFRHAVMTPAMLLMCEYLVRCPITSCRDIAIGSFLCSMVLSISRKSKKFYPEALIFLRTVLISALESGQKLPSHLQPWLKLRGCVSEVHSLDFLAVIDKADNSPIFSSDNFRISVLVSEMDILRGFVQVYDEYNSFPELFMPISTLLNEVSKQNHIPDELQEKINDVTKLIEKNVAEHHSLRQPLQLRKKRLEPIKMLNPKFEDNFVKGRDYDPDRERSEVKKLRKRLKREEKGATSELRKDNKFLAEAKMKAVAVEKEDRAEKARKGMAFLQEQQQAFNSGALGGKGKRRR
ncbi:hypothetical protein MKX03_028390 [Papaver bracteatum]|nr:hypothetical protein MKX03_028390 [Papaver bracteatum]